MELFYTGFLIYNINNPLFRRETLVKSQRPQQADNCDNCDERTDCDAVQLCMFQIIVVTLVFIFTSWYLCNLIFLNCLSVRLFLSLHCTLALFQLY